MGDTTTYRVETIYDVTDKASKQLQEIAAHAKQAAHHSETLKTVLLGMGGAVISSSIVHQAKHAFIDFNKEVQNAKISLSTMIQGNYNASFEQASGAANRLYSEFQKFSQQTPVTTQEMLEFSRGVAVATAQAGGSVRDIATMTERGVVAAKAMGQESGYAANELAHMLAGVVNRRMIFAQQILGMAHMSEEEFKTKNASQRLKIVEGVLGSDAMKEAAKQFGESFAGVTSTLEDKLQILGGKVGLPLFKAITEEVKNWNTWLDRNEAQVEYWAHKVGEALVKGFGYAKDAVMFMVDHASTLIKIAEAWAAVKVASMVGGGIAGTLQGFGAYGGKVSAGSVMGNAGSLAGAAAGGYLLGRELFASLNHDIHNALQPQEAALERATARLDEFELALAKAKDKLRETYGENDARSGARYSAFTVERTRMADKADALAALAAAANAGGSGLIDATGNLKLRAAGFNDADANRYMDMYQRAREGHGTTDINFEAANASAQLKEVSQNYANGVAFSNLMVNSALATMTEEQRQHLEVSKVTNALLEEYLKGNYMTVGKVVQELLGTDPDSKLKSTAKVNQNVTINIQQVSAKDPDRWLAEMDDMVARRVRAPTRARNGLARGF